jgi:2-oxoisovalerate ferredoxin oxidoreductase beta subunit
MKQEIIQYEKPKSFYTTFDRKGDGVNTTHYCPGCGHGTVQKLIAEAIDELGIQDRTIFLSPVGCAVFSYYYYDTGNIQCSHGRAPAVATGVKRTRKDAIVISYQGDGDLAGIGMTEIMHAANRGESITVFFINNAIYGMTGGQMAPTTPLGQKTLTTPFGRESNRDGGPIGMVEVMNSLQTPVYIERCAIGNPKHIMQTRKAIRKALQNQIDGVGFSFVEILSPCPTNWRMTPVNARSWIEQEMVNEFPLGIVRDRKQDNTRHVLHTHYPWLSDAELLTLLTGDNNTPVTQGVTLQQTQHITISGFGGQGVLSAGELLATCGMAENLSVSWLPSYGPEMRGGSAHVSVTLSEDEVGSPVIDHPNVLLAMNGPSLDHFEPLVAQHGIIIANSSIITRKVKRDDVTVISIPATEIARECGNQAAANVVMVTAYLLASKVLPIETLYSCIPTVLKKREFLEKNLLVVQRTIQYFENLRKR